jgi:phage terminase large subunit-like protein
MSKKLLTLGPLIARWIESNLCYGPGDRLGQPVELRAFQRDDLDRIFALTPEGRRRYDRVVIGYPRGSAKTEFAAFVGLAVLAGPSQFSHWDTKGRPVGVRRTDPDVVLAANNYEQAGLGFDAARAMVVGGALRDHYETLEDEIAPRNGDGRLRRIYSSARTADGLRPVLVIADELHEWRGDLFTKLSAARAKRADSWMMVITTAGWDPDTDLGRLYERGKAIERGDVIDDRFLFLWREAPEGYDLDNPDELREAICAAHPAVGPDGWLDVEDIIRQFYDLQRPDAERYWLNRWVSSPDRWLPEGAFEALAAPRDVPAGTEIVMGFDGSISDDSTVIIGATVEDVPHLWIIAMWERPDRGDFVVNPIDVRDALLAAARKFKVRAVGADPFRYRDTLAVVADAGVNVQEWPTHMAARSTPATLALYEAIMHEKLTHDGDPRLVRHFANATVKVDHSGTRLRKDPRAQHNKIDAAVAAMLAFDMAGRAPAPAPMLYVG